MTDEFKAGAEIEIAYPFTLEDISMFDADGPYETKSWRPGTYAAESEMLADGMGAQIMTVVSIHKPGKFPTRIFFTRRWRDPKGHEFGKMKLCMISVSAFRTRCRGFRHEFRLADPAFLSQERGG